METPRQPCRFSIFRLTSWRHSHPIVSGEFMLRQPCFVPFLCFSSFSLCLLCSSSYLFSYAFTLLIKTHQGSPLFLCCEGMIFWTKHVLDSFFNYCFFYPFFHQPLAFVCKKQNEASISKHSKTLVTMERIIYEKPFGEASTMKWEAMEIIIR